MIEHYDELSNLKKCGTLQIWATTGLRDLRGLENLTHVSRMLEITSNKDLESLDGLNSLIQCGGLAIEDNPKLETLNGLESMRMIDAPDNITTGFFHANGARTLKIKDNKSLISILSLDQLVKVQTVSIWENMSLQDCAINYICDSLIGQTPSIILWNNAPGCSSGEEALNACGIRFNYAKGKAFLDLNCNHIQDSTENGIANQVILSKKGHLPFTSTSNTGEFYNYIVFDTVILAPRPRANFTIHPDQYEIIADTANFVFDSLDFAFCPDTFFHDLIVTITGFNPPRPGFDGQYQVCAKNSGTFTEDAIFNLDFSNFPNSDLITIVSVEGSPSITGKKITWEIVGITPFESVCFNVVVHLNASAPLGEPIGLDLNITPLHPLQEINELNNKITLYQVIVGSFDPNDKLVNNQTLDFQDRDSPLEYTIRFQNTGTYNATFIEVIDTLQNELDIRTFEMIAASHPYKVSFPDSNIIKWRFDNIMLPDSNTNELLSHGFIRFKINPRILLAANSIIQNIAAIYFDFNSPVITNIAETRVDVVSHTTEDIAFFDFVIFPNPTHEIANLQFYLEQPTDLYLEIANLDGKILKAETYTGLLSGSNVIPVSFDNFPEGIFIIKASTRQQQGVKKLIYLK